MDTRRKETDKKIKAAFITLMETKPPSKITAQELCSKAHINRSTFYDHYPYMDALIRDIIHDQVMAICMDEATSKAYFQEPVSSIPHQVIRSYIHRFRSNRILDTFMTAENSQNYAHIFVDEQINLLLDNVGYSHEKYYRVYFQNVAATATITRWLMDKEPISEDALIDIIANYSEAMYMT